MITLNYIGCKKTLSDMILDIIFNEIGSAANYTAVDLFAGTGIMGYKFSKIFKSVISNDLEFYSFVINKAILCCPYSDKLQKIIDKCNALDPVEGLITQNYSPLGPQQRMFFTIENAKKADSIRTYIEEIYTNKEIDENEYYFLVASLLISVDKVANTTSVYGAFLKKFKKSALAPLVLMPIHKDPIKGQNLVENKPAEELVKEIQCDVIYMDPPYNHRQYSANYAPLNYIAEYDKKIQLTGKTGLIKDYNKSGFCSKSRVLDVFREMIADVDAKYIVLSYNNEGLLSKDDIKNILLTKGDVKLFQIKYNKFKAQKTVTKKYVYEYLWVVKYQISAGTFTEEIIES